MDGLVMKKLLSLLLVSLISSTQVAFAQYTPAGGGGTGSPLNNGQVWIGNGSNQATPVTPSGGATVSNTGVVTLANPSPSSLGGIQSFAFQASNWISSISTSGVPSATQPSFSDLSGSATLSQFPTQGNNTVLGNVTGSTGVPTALTAAQLTTIPNLFTSVLKGLVPASGGGTTTFLRADGIFAAPSTGAVSSVSNSDGTITASPTTGAVVVSIPSSVALAGSPTTTTQSSTDNSTKIATTSYVTTAINNAIAAVNPAVATQAATTTVLPNTPTYSNGVAGIGATLTSSTNSVLTIDGYTPLLNDRVLVKNQATAANNGIYLVTQLGVAAVTPWILTRALDYDQPSDINNTGAIPVVNGTTNATTSWVVTSTVNTIGTDSITFTQFSVSPSTIQTTTLNNTKLWIGNASNIATAVNLSGGATVTNSGVVTLGNPGASTLGGIQSFASVSNQWINSISTSGVPSASQPAFSNISGNLATSQMPTGFIHPQQCRITLTSGVPVTTSDVTAATNFFVDPYLGNLVSLPDSSGNVFTTLGFSEITTAVPSAIFRIYDIFLFNNSGSVAVDTLPWDSSGQTTGTITAVSLANPPVLTATNTLSAGQFMGIAGVVGTAGTNSTRGLNGRVFKVASATGSTITLETGNDTSGLTYTSGGTFYVIPTARTTALTLQNGFYLKSTDKTRLYIGSIMAGAEGVSGQAQSAASGCLVWNMFNRLPKQLLCVDNTSSWAYQTLTPRPQNDTIAPGVDRMEMLIGISEDAYDGALVTTAANTLANTSTYIALADNNVSNLVGPYAQCILQVNNQNMFCSLAVQYPAPAIGYHFLQVVEEATASGTCTHVGTFNQTVIEKF